MSTYALVMGGTRGLGLKIAEEAVRRGHAAVATGRTAEKAVEDGIRFARQDFTDQADPLGEVAEIVTRKKPSYVFWVGGIFLMRRLAECSADDIGRMVQTHLTGPLLAMARLQSLMTTSSSPYHFTVVGSTSSYNVRERETVYCTLKAAKAAFALNFACELARELPGSKVTLANPGAMKTGFFDGTEIDASGLMDPAEVARIIWDRVDAQTAPFDVVNIENGCDLSVPVVIGGLQPLKIPT